MTNPMNVIVMGAHVLDVPVRPVDTIPDGQGGALVEEVSIQPGGPAGGTALTLAKLGASVRSAGAIGADLKGDILSLLLERAGVDTTMLVRRTDQPTSATVVLVRPDGSHPSLHLLGANIAYAVDDVDFDAIAATDYLHLGAPELLGTEMATRVLKHAKNNGVITCADLIAPGEMGSMEAIEPLLPYLDVITPNEDQILGFTKCAEVIDAANLLHSRGVGLVVVTCGSAGALLVSAEGPERVPAFAVDVVDTSGCGDAFSAGLLRGLSLGRGYAEAARLGCATAALVAQGVGIDSRRFNLTDLEELETTTPTR